ncbi:MAG: T9SS type A sorting domain-containing protein [Bacteroidota bacterium]|nr:T9SS type A sorting domain-containing protein [Bacteroidota bacterium]
MKKLCFTLVLFLFCCSFMHAQWRQSLTGQTSLINNLSVVTDNVIWALDQMGQAVSVSTDGGASWIVKSLPSELVAGNVTSLSATSATTAYLIVSDSNLKGIYKTTDSGFTWTKQATGFNASSPWPDFVYFWNENDGVAVGDPINNTFEIYVTTNGGELWTQVPVQNIPLCDQYEFGYSSNTVFKVLGNSICFYTNKGRLFRSWDKGLTWSVVSTPLTSGSNMSVVFKDDNHGLCSNADVYTSDYQLYATSDGGSTWNSVAGVQGVKQLYYSAALNAYFSANLWLGLMYSLDDGLTWTTHPSMDKMGISGMGFLPSGKVVAGGWSYVYTSTDYQKQNISVTDIQLNSKNSLTVSFSEEPDPETSQLISNYTVGYVEHGLNALDISSATQDPINKNVIHLQMAADLPLDTIRIYVSNVKDNKGADGYSMINELPSSHKTIYNLTSAAGHTSATFDIFVDQTSRCLTLSGTIRPGKAEIIDLNGRVLLSESINSMKIALPCLAPGIYLLKWKDNTETRIKKFSVK